MMTGNLPVVPTVTVSAYPIRPVNSAATARMSTQRSFFSKSTPAARPESFSSQAARVNESIQRNGQFQAVNGSRAAENPGANRPGLAGQSASRQQPPLGNSPMWGSAPTRQRAFAIPSSLRCAAARRLTDKGSVRKRHRARMAGSVLAEIRALPITNGLWPSRKFVPMLSRKFRNNSPVGREPNNGNVGQASGWQRFSGLQRTRGGSVQRLHPPAAVPTLDMNKPIVNERSYRPLAIATVQANRGSSDRQHPHIVRLRVTRRRHLPQLSLFRSELSQLSFEPGADLP